MRSEGYSTWVCVSVCLSVKSHLTYGASVRSENAVTYSEGNEGQKICGDLPETTAFKSYAAKHERKSQYANYSDLPAVSFLRLIHSEAPEGNQRLSTTNIQPCPKRCLLIPLARVGARTDSTTHSANRRAWSISRARALA